ncbi:MAG TPA: geranylgeranylglyceryl/heptaprenylglyceryl phosphate synthase [Gemmatimonadales bacterium]|jgi:putative glycerol-1-phosphate prenyltransferase|nr:geranylgeranylglyceryl/heptaprenylglyceryl phosphate synthase [Gemmatimonadales bacterium]
MCDVKNPTLGHPGILVLVDPGRTAPVAATRVARAAQAARVAGLMIGSSFDGAPATPLVARAIREAAPDVPLILFPGSAQQLTDEVDLVLFLSLISGRNAQYLIEEAVRAVPFLARHPVPTLSTGYILIDGGRVTSVEAVSQTRPLPANKPELVAAHATAAQLIGMRAIYVDAGSGAPHPVPAEAIAACHAAVPGLVLFVGGGIRTPEQARAARAAGADFVVVGTVLEELGADAAEAELQAMVEAVRTAEPPGRPR